VPKSTHPLTIQDYISILIDNDKYLDSELVNMINNLPSLASRYKRLSNHNNQLTNDTDISGKRNISFVFWFFEFVVFLFRYDDGGKITIGIFNEL